MSKKKFNPGDKFILEIGEKRTGLDEYEIVGTDLWVWGSLLEKLTPYERDHNADVSKKVECPTFEDSSQYAQPDNRLSKIAELVEGTIDHFDLDDAMDLLYQIKEVVGNETSNIRG